MSWKDETSAAAVRHGIEPSERFVAQLAVESADFDEDIIAQRRLSSAGARGIAQFMTPTGNWVASSLGVPAEQFWADPLLQLDGAAWYMQQLLTQHRTWVHALAAYNAGSGNLARWLDRSDTLLPFDETIRYVSRIMDLSYEDAKAALLPPRACAEGAQMALAQPVALPALAFNPNVPYSPDDKQWLDWTCSIHTVQQALEAVGSQMPYTDVYNLMVETLGVVDARVGFHDHTGKHMAEMFRRLGYQAHAEYPVDFDRVWEEAGTEPICLSIDGHYHWMFVRSRADENTLNLSNSAPGHMGVQQTITRWQWAQIGGGASAVHIDIPDGEDPRMIAELQARIAELSGINDELGRQVADKEERLHSLVEGFAHVTDVIVPAMAVAASAEDRKALVAQAQQIREERIGQRQAA